MIRQVSKLPVVEPEGVDSARRGWRLGLFVAAEVVLILAVPLLAWFGFQSLLGSRSGAYLVDPTPSDPGWLAFVDPTPVSLVIEMVDNSVSGLTVVASSGSGATGGVLMLVPGALVVDGVELRAHAPDEAARAVSKLLRLEFENVVIAHESGWRDLIGDSALSISNPDPVSDSSGDLLLPVGRVELDASTVPAFLGRPLSGAAPLALEFRRDIFWDAAMNQPDLFADSSVIASQLAAVAAGVNRVEPLPTTSTANGIVEPDHEAIEALVIQYVALPSGSDRLEVRVLDRSGTNDLEAVALELGRAGFAVVQIGNASVFDGGPSQIITAPGADDQAVGELAALLRAATVMPSNDEEAVSTVTVLLGDRELFSSDDE